MRDITYLPALTLRNGHTDTVSSLAFSPSGNFLASGGDDAEVIVWDMEKGISVARIALQSPVISLLWDVRRSTALFCRCQDGALLLFSDIQVRSGILPGSRLILLTALNSQRKKPHKHDILIGSEAPVYSLHMHGSSRDLAITVGCEVHVAKELSKG